MTYFTRSLTDSPVAFGSLTIPRQWTKVDLGEDEAAVFVTLTDLLEIRTDPPGPILNPSGKVWFPGVRSYLVDE